MATTLKDIAKIAGVSESTVSRCLNDSKAVSEKTKARIKGIAEELDFEFNINARNLAKKKSNRIGIIFSEGYYKFNKRHFFASLEEYLIKYVEEKGYEAVIFTLSQKNLKANLIKRLVGSKEVDGLLIVTRDIKVTDIKMLQRKKFPFNFVYYKPTEAVEEVNIYTSDNIYSGYLATSHLITNGCKKIATITSINKEQKNYAERTRGYREALMENDIKLDEKLLVEVDVDFSLAENLAREKEELFKGVDGVFCQQDKVALGLMKGLLKLGFKIPEDISIIGHDDLEIIEYFDPKLTTIKQPFENICKNAVTDIFNQIDGRKKDLRKIFMSSVVERETVKK